MKDDVMLWCTDEEKERLIDVQLRAVSDGSMVMRLWLKRQLMHQANVISDDMETFSRR